MLTIENLEVYHGGIHALRGVSLEVEEGRIVALVGSNGAGKSTALRSIVGLAHPRSGSIKFLGRELTRLRTHKIIQLGIGVSPEGRHVFPNLTVLENLELGGCNLETRADLNAGLEWVYSLFPRLEERRGQLSGTLSGGEQQMLAFGRALMGKPKLVLLDEPSLGLAPLVAEEVFGAIETINRQGATVLLVEQNAMATLRIAHYAYVLETGQILFEGAGKDLLGDERVRKAYLGEGSD